MASTVAIEEADLQSWSSEWQQIERAVRELYPNLEGFERDSATIATLLSEGKYVMHHSKVYNSTYTPHYRIVSREEYDKRKDRLK